MIDPSGSPSSTTSDATHHVVRRVLAPLGAALSFGWVPWRMRHRVFAVLQLVTSAAAVLGAIIVMVTGYWLDIALSPWKLIVSTVVVVVACAIAACAAVVRWHELDRSQPMMRWAGGAGLAVAVLAAALPAVVASYVMVPQIKVSQRTFVSAPIAEPHPLEPSPTTAAASTPATPATSATSPTSATSSTAVRVTVDGPTSRTAPPTLAPRSTAPPTTDEPPVVHEWLNVLLLGGDAGPGRWGLRTDSVNLVSIDLATGDATIVGIPRNLSHAPLPPGPLRDRFPKGFTDIFNALYPWGALHPTAVQGALGPTDDPGASLVAASAAELLGVRIDAWVLIDMAGFIDVIDALGGLNVYVPKRIRSPGNPPTAKHPVKSHIDAGWHQMDGTDALSYARSRNPGSDYERMARQRCLLAGLAAQKSPLQIAANWIALSRVIADRIRTNLDVDQLRTLIRFAGSSMHSDRVVALTPPLVPEAGWDAAEVRRIVAEGIAGTSPDESVPPTTGANGIAPTSGTWTIGEVCLTKPG